jgi:tRNA U34 2-thiouridine synthase MnmA/TrmU
LSKQKGIILDIENKSYLGEHNGIFEYTIGQRIVIDNNLNTNKKAYFVAKKDKQSKVLYVVNHTNHPALYFDKFQIEKPHWICENKEANLAENEEKQILDNKFDFKFQNKHLQSPIVYLKKNIKDNYITSIKYPFRGISAGQYCVFYLNDECIGSAKIMDTLNSLYDMNYDGNISNTDKIFTKQYIYNNKKNMK